jgi:hypothetical protein
LLLFSFTNEQLKSFVLSVVHFWESKYNGQRRTILIGRRHSPGAVEGRDGIPIVLGMLQELAEIVSSYDSWRNITHLVLVLLVVVEKNEKRERSVV